MNITEHFPKHHTDMTITIDKNLSWKLQWTVPIRERFIPTYLGYGLFG
jgi:hypothetical protein